MPASPQMSRTMAGYRPGLLPARPAAAAAPVHLPAGAGELVNAGGMPALVKVDPGWGEHVPLGIWEEIGPGRLVRAHAHPWAQCSLVLKGTLMFRVGDEECTASEGDSVWRDPGVPHAVWNPDEKKPAVQFELCMPGDFVSFCRQYGALAGTGVLGPGELAKLAPLYGLTYDDAMTAAVEAAYPRVSAAGPAQ